MTTITAPAEQKILDEVPKQLYIGGEWRDGAKGTLSVEDPSTGESLCDVADASTDDAKAALTAAVRGRPRLGRARPARARRDPPPRVRGDHRPRRRPGAADDARDGQAARRVQGRDRLRRRVLPLVLRGVRPDRRALRGQLERAGARADDEAAGRAVSADHAVELPAGDGHPQDRPGDRRRVHDGRQAGAADAAVDADAGQDPRGGRPAGRGREPRHRVVLERDDGAADRRLSGCASCRSPARPRSGAS